MRVLPLAPRYARDDAQRAAMVAITPHADMPCQRVSLIYVFRDAFDDIFFSLLPLTR